MEATPKESAKQLPEKKSTTRKKKKKGWSAATHDGRQQRVLVAYLGGQRSKQPVLQAKKTHGATSQAWGRVDSIADSYALPSPRSTSTLHLKQRRKGHVGSATKKTTPIRPSWDDSIGMRSRGEGRALQKAVSSALASCQCRVVELETKSIEVLVRMTKGEAAVGGFQGEGYDVVVMGCTSVDYEPIVIRALKLIPSVPVLVVATNPNIQAMTTFLKAGASDCVLLQHANSTVITVRLRALLREVALRKIVKSSVPKEDASSEQRHRRERVALRWKLGFVEKERRRADSLAQQLAALDQEKRKPVESKMGNVIHTLKKMAESMSKDDQATIEGVLDMLNDPNLHEPSADQLSTSRWVMNTYSTRGDTVKNPKHEGNAAKKSLSLGPKAHSSTPPPQRASASEPSDKDLRSSFTDKFEQHGGDATTRSSMLQCATDWEYDVWKLEGTELDDLVVEIMMDLGLCAAYDIPRDRLQLFVHALGKEYKSNPYHCWRHAVDVVHLLYLLLINTNVGNYLSNVDVLGLMLAALCHDIGHPGRNNDFESKVASEIALVYNDQSVLENHHASHAWRTLIIPFYDDLLGALSKEEQEYFRKLFVQSILSTDMARHFELTSKFSQRLETKPFSHEDPVARVLLVEWLLHVADISNVTRPKRVHERWSQALMDEFCNLGDLQREHEMKVGPMYDRAKLTHKKMNRDFIAVSCRKYCCIAQAQFIAKPAFDLLYRLLPEVQPIVDHLEANYASVQEEETKQK